MRKNWKLLAVLVVCCAVLSAVTILPQAARADDHDQKARVEKSISGNIHPDGSIGGGTGFTCVRLGTGTYEVTFPASTWNGKTFPIVIVTPIFCTPPVNLRVVGYAAGGDGSLVVDFDNAGVDVNFFFVVTQS